MTGACPAADRPAALDADKPDPFAYAEARRAEFERRAAAGYAHVVYAKSPAAWWPPRRVAAYPARSSAWPATAASPPRPLEAIVFLESAGRPAAAADPKLEGAVGLTQILAETGQNLLGMQVDPAGARKLTRRIERAERRGQTGRADRLRARRRRVDERFDPGASLGATARYLKLAGPARRARRPRRGRLPHGDRQPAVGAGRLRAGPGSYAELYFGRTPTRQPAAYRRLAGLGDDSSTYLWRVQASRDDHAPLPQDPGALESAAELQRPRTPAEEVLHPEGDTEVFANPDDLEAAYRDGKIRSFPNAPGRLGLRRDRQMGELARRLEQPRRLYRGLRPEAYALAAYRRASRARPGAGARR